MGYLSSTGLEDLGGKWKYSFESEDEEKNTSQIGNASVSNEAKIEEKKIDNKAGEIINKSVIIW